MYFLGAVLLANGLAFLISFDSEEDVKNFNTLYRRKEIDVTLHPLDGHNVQLALGELKINFDRDILSILKEKQNLYVFPISPSNPLSKKGYQFKISAENVLRIEGMMDFIKYIGEISEKNKNLL